MRVLSRLTARRLAKKLATGTAIGRLFYKTQLVARFYPRAALRHPALTLRYVLIDPEITNFTYEIANHQELVEFIARSTALPVRDVQRVSDELRGDEELARSLAALLVAHGKRRTRPLYGRRVGWYCVVRLLKPRVVVETGVADGLGSAVLLRALERNEAEGRAGTLLSIDVDPTSGWLVPEELRRCWTLVIGNSHAVLPRSLTGRALDLFIHDSDHDHVHELTEYRLIEPHLAPGATIISDNAHAATALAEYAGSAGHTFDLFRERPLDHFYPGGGIGIARLPVD